MSECVRGLVLFVVAVLAVAVHVYHHIVGKLLSVVKGKVSRGAAGCGGAALAVLSRCARARALLVERDPRMVALARQTLTRVGESGELEDAALPPGDRERLVPAFAAALLAMYHRRVGYAPTPTAAP